MGPRELETEEAVDELASWNLVEVESGERRGRTLSLIDLHLDYLRASAKEDLARWHAALLRGCGRRTLGNDEDWDEHQDDDNYWNDGGNVLRHMMLCGWAPGALSGELMVLYLRNPDWRDVSGLHQLGDEEAKGLATMVKASSSLKFLYLADNCLGDETAKAFAEVIRAGGSLTSLWITMSRIGDEGAEIIAEAIHAGGSLLDLSLDDNNIGDIGAKAFAEVVHAGGRLTSLGLNGNDNIGDEGARAIAEAIRSNDALVLKTLGVPNELMEHAEIVAACQSKGVDLQLENASDDLRHPHPYEVMIGGVYVL